MRALVQLTYLRLYFQLTKFVGKAQADKHGDETDSVRQLKRDFGRQNPAQKFQASVSNGKNFQKTATHIS
jgi:hypothetical protein